jgi:hypothetical protein
MGDEKGIAQDVRLLLQHVHRHQWEDHTSRRAREVSALLGDTALRAVGLGGGPIANTALVRARLAAAKAPIIFALLLRFIHFHFCSLMRILRRL